MIHNRLLHGYGFAATFSLQDSTEPKGIRASERGMPDLGVIQQLLTKKIEFFLTHTTPFPSYAKIYGKNSLYLFCVRFRRPVTFIKGGRGVLKDV